MKRSFQPKSGFYIQVPESKRYWKKSKELKNIGNFANFFSFWKLHSIIYVPYKKVNGPSDHPPPPWVASCMQGLWNGSLALLQIICSNKLSYSNTAACSTAHCTATSALNNCSATIPPHNVVQIYSASVAQTKAATHVRAHLQSLFFIWVLQL